MPSTSSGRITKSSKGKKSTPHQKNHRWESFQTKISKLHSLDPLRKVRRHDLDAESLDSTTSYFRNGLEKWNELNIARGFISFKREVLPLSESLPQILHFEDKIFQLLAQYISMQEKESFETLLDLLTAFARDLKTRFEKHYAAALELVVAVAGKPQDVDVVEWTFATLAFLFKYLSKFLVPDLRPTYDVLAPLMGKARHPPYIARFAAEAVSFLVRKAASPSTRGTSLVKIVEHIRSDLVALSGDRQFQLYQDGIMTLFAEAMKGTGTTLHSTSPVTLRELIKAIGTEKSPKDESIWTDVVCGVLTSVTHHSDANALSPLLDVAVEEVQTLLEQGRGDSSWRVLSLARILATCAGVRSGSRVSNWAPVVRSLNGILDFTTKRSPAEVSREEENRIWRDIIVSAAIVWHAAPMDALIPCIKDFMAALQREPLMRLFIPFCAYSSELDPQRFRSLFQSYFQRFITSHWSDGHNDDELCIFLPRMVEAHSLPAPGEKETCNLPRSWQDQIVAKFERLEVSPFPERGTYDKDPQTWRDRCLPKYSMLLGLLDSTTVHPSATAKISDLLLRKLKLALRPTSSLASDEVHFSVSQGFLAYLRMSKVAGPVDPALEPLLRASLPRFSRSIGFLQAFLAYEEARRSAASDERRDSSSSGMSSEGEDPVIKSLVENLSSPSHDLRLVTLKILAQYDAAADDMSCLSIMTQIEESPLEIATMRAIAMHIRKLGQNYSLVQETSWLRQAIPAFLFGILTVKLTPLWNDASSSLEVVSQTKQGEEAVFSLALDWLDIPSSRDFGAGTSSSAHTYKPRTDFDCSHFQRLLSKAEEVHHTVENVLDLMLQSFDKQQQTIETHPVNARSQALKVLNKIPAVGEKRSRKLVPYFLSWASDAEESTDGQDTEEEKDHFGAENWSLYDRKGMLGVFENFVNPKSLYKSDAVYQALLRLMENGDVEVQKSVLKAILAWKQEGIIPYQENLEYLLDEARFKNELTVLMQGEQTIRPEHRAELMPLLLRLLYGRTISKKGAASGRHGLQATRLAVLRNLSQEDMAEFLNIAVGKLHDVQVANESGLCERVFSNEVISPRKQVGLMNMMLPVINELGTDVQPYVETLLNTVLYCLIFACRALKKDSNAESGSDMEVEDEAEKESSHDSLLKASRTTGLKCLNALFRNAPDFGWERYAGAIVAEVVSPRIDNLAAENTQGVSGLMTLLSIWAQLPRAALFLSINDQVLPRVIECVSVEKSKDEVKIFCLGIIRDLVKLAKAPAAGSEFNELIKATLLEPNTDELLRHVTVALETESMGATLLDACLGTVVDIAPLVETSQNISKVLQISIFLLNQPPKKVNPRAKGQLLLIIEQFVTLNGNGGVDLDTSSDLFTTIFETVSALFSYFKDRENRSSLCRLLSILARHDDSLSSVSEISSALNAFAEGRLDEPDYDSRLAAFNRISSSDTPRTSRQWLPILHNLVFFLRNDEEFGVLSSNSADGMRAFVAQIASHGEQVEQWCEEHLSKIILPALYSGARESSAIVRRECLRVFGFILTKLPSWHGVADLKGLLSTVEEEASDPPFFFNILSPATARQLEALQILEAANLATEISSQNLYHFFIPILEHFIFGRADGTDDHGLGAQASATIGALVVSLEWKHYRAVLQRYISFVESKPDLQKQTVRLLGRVADALITASDARAADPMQVDGGLQTGQTFRLSRSLPEKIHADITNTFLPSLVKHLHEKDESEVSYRVPVGIIVVKLLKLLPQEEMGQKLAGVLTDISHVLRSKNGESRDLARDTLVQISHILGPSYFGFILKELRGALKRGYQLHVLSFTLHSMLLQVIPDFKQGDIDYCLPSIVAVIIDDIFGVTGQEKDAEDYTSQMKEIKASKSQDSMELIAKTASISHLIDLVHPLQSLLMQKIDLKIARKIDTLLSRITAGLLQNPAAESRDTLMFCYEVVQEVYKSQKPEAETKLDPRLKKYLHQKGVKKTEIISRNKHTYKLVKLALDILRTVWKKYESLRNEANITGFISILGDAIVAGEEEVKVAAFKLLTVLTKVPFTSGDVAGLYKVATKEATKSISFSATTSSDLSQSALKLVSIVLRDRYDIQVKNAAIDMLLGKLKDDLTEPLYRHVTFSFLRSVLDRKVETAAVYDTLDYVGTVMITNDDKDTRDLARGAFFQFLREYPQKKGRWAKQLNFIVANLKYEREGGRLSVMEIIHLLLKKSGDDFVQEIASTCFLPLVFVVANDESEKCRLASGELIKEIFRRADSERMKSFLALLRSWIEQEDNPAVTSLGLRGFGYFFEASEPSEKNKRELRKVVTRISSVLSPEEVSQQDADLINTALSTSEVLIKAYPAELLAPASQQLWTDTRRYLTHPESSVKVHAARLLGIWLTDFIGRTAQPGDTMTGAHGMQLNNGDIQEIVDVALSSLRADEAEEALANEVTQILIFLGPRLNVRNPDGNPSDTVGDDDDDDDDDDDSDDDGDNDNKAYREKDLQHLFWKLATILRQDVKPTSSGMVPKVAAMEVLETICRRVPEDHLAPSFKTILNPLQSMTDPAASTPFSLDDGFKTKLEAVKTRAQILMDSLQKRFGTAEYTRVLMTIREEARARRQARSSKRKIEAVTRPEKHSRDKRKKTEKKKERQKVRGKEFKAYRQAYKQW